MRFIRSLYSAVRSRRESDLPVSTMDLLPRFIKRKDLQRIALAIPDRRHLFEAVAKALNASESDLMRAVAQQANIPFVERPLPIDIGVLKAPLTIRDLRRSGALPIVTGEAVSGVICIDPSALVPLGAAFAKLPMYLSSWHSIAKALDESERIAVIRSEKRQHDENERRRKTVEAVLGHIIQESRKHGAKEVTIHTFDVPRYQFQSEDGRSAHGAIAPEIAAALGTLLEELASKARSLEGSRVERDIVAGAFRVSGTVAAQSQLYVVARDDLAEPSRQQKGRPTVLIVDDNPTFAKVLERFLTRQGVDITHVESVALADEELWGRQLPDLVVCDLHMPGPGGGELLDKVRQHPRTADLPFVMLTSDDDVETEVRLLTKGADAFVAKSEDPRILCAHVQRLLERTGRRSKVAA